MHCAVTGGITDRISLRLYNASAQPPVTDIMNRYFANQVAGQFHSVRREFRSTETPETRGKSHLAHPFHLAMRYRDASASSGSGRSSPSIVGMSSETVG